MQIDGAEAREITETRMLFLALCGGLLLFAGVAFVLVSRGMIEGLAPLTPAVRSAIVLAVGAGCFVGLKVCRTAYHPPRSADRAEVVSGFRTRSILGWAIVDGFGVAGICVGLIFSDPVQVLTLAAIATGGLFLGRPDGTRLDAALRRATE